MENLITTVEEVYGILNNLSAWKANGPDDIGNQVLKFCAIPLAEPIAHLINMSFKSGIFPQSWKTSNVVPIHKKGSKDDISNYRPISLLSNISKILERIVFTRLYTYCEQNNLLSSKNSGFKKKDNTVNQLLQIINKIHLGLDDGKEICLLFMDVTKAFDRVWHKGLIFKLKKIGIGGAFLNLLISYLSNRKQRVVLENKWSSFLEVMAGVPQGSILGPLLFLIFLNDIEDKISSDISLFADDTSLLKTFSFSHEAELTLNGDLSTLHEWSEKWMVKFNPAKTKYIVFSNKKKKSELNIYLDEKKIEKVASYKHLGVIFSEDFKWTNHIDSVVKKAKMKIGTLFRTKDTIFRRDKMKLYTQMSRPALEYGSVIYDNCSVLDSMKLESVQKYAARVCTGAMKQTNYKLLCQELNWQTLDSRRKIAKGLLTFKILNSLTPDYLKMNFMINTSQSLCLRKNAVFCLPKCRLTSYAKSFFPSQIKFWNNLRPETRDANSLQIFKKGIEIIFYENTESNSDH